jgi:pimeloyl-ACP methyl ester carboxylesterase
MLLNTITHPGPAMAPPLLIAHGLFGSARNWGVIARHLSAGRMVRAADMRNHGGSFWDPVHDYPAMAADLAALIDGPQDVLGHSMGGKAAMVLALTRPEKVRRLVVADIAPVAYGHSQSRQIDAMRRVDLTTVTSRADALAQMQPDSPALGAFLLQSLDLAARRWRLNLDVLAQAMPQIVGWPDIAGRFDGPALFLSGADSDYVRPEHRPLIRALFPQARFARLTGAGHWLHAEQPAAFVDTVTAFLHAP